MKQALTRLSSSMTALFSMMFGIAQRQADHKKLTRHILELNKQQSSKEIINEVAVCLKDILSYRLFAFVIKEKNGVDIWLDPRMYKNSLEDIILKDFNIFIQTKVQSVNTPRRRDIKVGIFIKDELIDTKTTTFLYSRINKE